MPLEVCSLISSVTVSLKRDDGDKGFRFKGHFIRFFSGSSDIFFSVPQQLNSASHSQAKGRRASKAPITWCHDLADQKQWDRSHLNPTALIGCHCY